MIRRLLLLASAISLVLCAAIVVLWARSLSGIQQVTVYKARRYSASLDHGRFSIQRCTCAQIFTGEDGPLVVPTVYSLGWKVILGTRIVDHNGECDDPSDPAVDRAGIVYRRPSEEARDEVIAGPVWPIVLLTGMPAMILLARRMRKLRVRPGRCRVCGYDLRASPERCPECGKLVIQTGGRIPLPRDFR